MDNLVHLILVPPREESLRATLAEAHRRYSRMVNMREGWRGYLFQGRTTVASHDNPGRTGIHRMDTPSHANRIRYSMTSPTL